MSKTFKRWLVILGGWAFVAVGVAGLFLPFLQGILFLLIGVSILSSEYAWARRLLQKLRRRFPSFSARIDTAQTRAREWMKHFPFMKSDKARN